MRIRVVTPLALFAIAVVMATSSATVATATPSGVQPLDDCRMGSPLPTFNEGFAIDLQAAESTGTLTVQILYAEFADLAPGGPDDKPVAQIRDAVSKGVDQLEALSGGRLDVVVREHPEPVVLSQPFAAYPGSAQSAWPAEVMTSFVTDTVAAADPSVDFADSDATWIFFPYAYPLPSRAQASNSEPVSADGVSLSRVVTFPRISDDPLVDAVIHETGHTLGLPDLYDSAHSLGSPSFIGEWDLMSSGDAENAAFFGWHLWRLGWIDDSQVTCLEPGGGGIEVTLDALTRRGSSVIAVMPTSAYRAVVVESRRAEGPDGAIPRPGVLVYILFTDTPSGSGPVFIGPRDGTVFPTDRGGFANATLVLGDRYTDWASNMTVTVIASDEGSDTVRIAPVTDGTPPPVEPDDETPPPPGVAGGDVSGTDTDVTALPATGASDTAGGLAAAVVMLVAGLVVLVAGRIRSEQQPAGHGRRARRGDAHTR